MIGGGGGRFDGGGCEGSGGAIKPGFGEEGGGGCEGRGGAIKPSFGEEGGGGREGGGGVSGGRGFRVADVTSS